MAKNLFFDLDHTLWDFERNSRDSLREIFDSFIDIHKPVFSCDEFIDSYEKVNDRLWQEYGLGKLTKAELRYRRFSEALRNLDFTGINIYKIDKFYVETTPQRTHLFPHTKETLGRLLKLGYKLHLITNGFNESQRIKIYKTGLSDFFDSVTTAESAGFWKPDVRIFYSAMSKPKARPENSWMIGDHLDRDIRGANRAGMCSVWFNPKKVENKSIIKPRFEISELPQVIEIIER